MPSKRSISRPLPVRLLLIVIGMLMLILAGCGDAEAARPTSVTNATAAPAEPSRSVISATEATIWLEAPKGRHQTGWARLWEGNDSLFVEIDVSPAAAVAQPAHIHLGECLMLGGIDHRLENVIGGHSLTELPGVTIADLATGDLAINLHQSFADFATFTACGEIPSLPVTGQSG